MGYNSGGGTKYWEDISGITKQIRTTVILGVQVTMGKLVKMTIILANWPIVTNMINGAAGNSAIWLTNTI